MSLERASIRLHGVQTAAIERNTVAGSAPVRITHTVGTPRTAVTGNTFTATPRPIVVELNYEGEPRAKLEDNQFLQEPNG